MRNTVIVSLIFFSTWALGLPDAGRFHLEPGVCEIRLLGHVYDHLRPFVRTRTDQENFLARIFPEFKQDEALLAPKTSQGFVAQLLERIEDPEQINRLVTFLRNQYPMDEELE